MLSLAFKEKTMRKLKTIIIVLASILILVGCSKSEDLSPMGTGDKNSPSGKGGSTARITIKGDYLYAVDNSSLKVVEIINPDKPKYIKTIDLGFGIETIYPFKDYLFIGSNSGMFVYGLSDPANPNKLSEFNHATACDPVIANDSLAFITLRSTEICNRWDNTKEINVVNIENISSPNLIMIYHTQYAPYGLDMNDSILFVCHGKDGLITYNIDKLKKNLTAEISSIKGINAYDAILWQNKLFVIGESGFYQYDYSDINNIKLISSIVRGSF